MGRTLASRKALLASLRFEAPSLRDMAHYGPAVSWEERE
jgi:hypothetical protein